MERVRRRGQDFCIGDPATSKKIQAVLATKLDLPLAAVSVADNENDKQPRNLPPLPVMAINTSASEPSMPTVGSESAFNAPSIPPPEPLWKLVQCRPRPRQCLRFLIDNN